MEANLTKHAERWNALKHLMRRKIKLNRSMITNVQRSVEKMI